MFSFRVNQIHVLCEKKPETEPEHRSEVSELGALGLTLSWVVWEENSPSSPKKTCGFLY